MSCWAEKSALTVQGAPFMAFREGMVSGDFVLQAADGSELARATKPDAFHRRFLVQHEGRSFTLAAAAALTRRFVLLDLPEDLPLAVRVLLVWLVLVM